MPAGELSRRPSSVNSTDLADQNGRPRRGPGLASTPVILLTLMERRGRVQSRRQLLEAVWETTANLTTHTVDMHVQRLRSKLGEHGDWIETVRGFGYPFRPERSG